MTPERLQQVEQLYHAALERAESERGAFLEKACSGDEVLRRDVESLLIHDKKAKDFLESPALGTIAKALTRASEGVVQPVGPSLTTRTISDYRIVDDRGGQQGPGDQPPADLQSPQDENATPASRPRWWMYLIAAAFRAHVVFITAFFFLGPE